MKVLFVGKRFYTNRDVIEDRFGRQYWLPHTWKQLGQDVKLWLVDYHSRQSFIGEIDTLPVMATPLISWSAVRAGLASLTFRPTHVVASGDAYLGAVGWAIARMSRARFIFDVYDKYDEFEGYRRPLGMDFYRWLLERADCCFFASRALMESDGKICGGDVALVPNGVDPERFRPLPKAECRVEIGLEVSGPVVGYFGSMEEGRGVSDLIEAIRRLNADGAGICLLLAGSPIPSGADKIGWIDYRGVVPHDLIPKFLGACDVLALPYRSMPIMDMGASCKSAEYLAAQRPIVTTRNHNFTKNFPEQARSLDGLMPEPGEIRGLECCINLQLERQLTVEAPTNFGWRSIAAEALASI